MKRILFSLFVSSAAFLSAAPSIAAQSAVEAVANAPASHTVVPGDTLWGIAKRFIKSPWRWPEVWRMNRDQIRNPHLIYPGQVVMFDPSGPWLSIGKPVGKTIEPRIYTDADEPVATIPMSIITPFLARSTVMDAETMKSAPTIISVETNRIMTAAGDTVFADKIGEGESDSWELYRPLEPITNVDGKEVLGYEAQYLGAAQVTANGEPATLEILSAEAEIAPGTRLQPEQLPSVFSYVPHAPETAVEGHIVKLHRAVAEAGRYSVVLLNIGSRDNVEPGHVLALYRNRGEVEYSGEVGKKGKTYLLPEQRYGLMMVFRVFDRVSYALVMDASGSVKIGDRAYNP